MTDHERRVYKNHIRRLQETNLVLSQALVEQNQLRRDAYLWYRNKIHSKVWWFWAYVLFTKTLVYKNK